MRYRISILANKTNTFGIAKDIKGFLKVFDSPDYDVVVCDPLEPPVYSDIAIHLEVPVYVWMPWAAKNIFVINPEWYVDAWEPYLHRFDKIIVKDTVTMKRFEKWSPTCINWAHSPPKIEYPLPERDEFLWALGGSVNKRAYVSALLPLWKKTYPKLTITMTTPLEIPIPDHVEVIVKDFSESERIEFFGKFKGQVCCSRAEGFGYSAAETELFGAFTILNSLPVYVETYRSDYRVAFLPSRFDSGFDVGATNGSLEEALDTAMDSFSSYTLNDCVTRRQKYDFRWATFKEGWDNVMNTFQDVDGFKPPPLLHPSDCPPISVVTLIHNRKIFFNLARHNIMITDYPKDKIEWIVVDDSDDPAEQNSDEIVQASNSCEPLKMVYVPLLKKVAVSEKRNIGVRRASANIILMMDDDDHYPETSFRRRVAWLTKHPWNPKAVSATTIACYDLLKGISAVNSPPMGLPLSQRISEATLTFYKSWWEEKKFPSDIIVGEGEGFLVGREKDVLEIPPQQIIVAFSHGKNVSSRRIPTADISPGCFWGFPKEYLEFIHRLAGVKVEQA